LIFAVQRPAGRKYIDACADAALAVDNLEGATSQNWGLTLSERWTQLLRNRKKEECEIHCRECNEASWGLHLTASDF